MGRKEGMRERNSLILRQVHAARLKVPYIHATSAHESPFHPHFALRPSIFKLQALSRQAMSLQD